MRNENEMDCEPWESAIRSRIKGTNGFQGCVNKERCRQYGFYLNTYSKEGLCEECECDQFPERFVACPFCRQPMSKVFHDQLSTCYGSCYSRIADYIANEFQMSSNYFIGSSRCVTHYLESTEKTIHRNFIRKIMVDGKILIYRGVQGGRHIWSTRLHPDTTDLGHTVCSR